MPAPRQAPPVSDSLLEEVVVAAYIQEVRR